MSAPEAAAAAPAVAPAVPPLSTAPPTAALLAQAVSHPDPLARLSAAILATYGTPVLPSLASVNRKYLSTSEAKFKFFLDSGDLSEIPSSDVRFIPGGFGSGPGSTWYAEDALRRQAIRKHGEEGFEQKLAARARREENKR